MSDWHWYETKPKRPPPERGIRMKKSGATWWGKRWLEALERMSAGYKNRLARGRSYARAGRTHDLVVKPGVITALVTGTRAAPYKVRIVIAPLSDTAWSEAIGAMSAEARFAATLLGGEMPTDIDAAFGKGRASLFPTRASDLETACSCPDWANPCKHVAATHYVLGEALDRDPFLLFELRGRNKEQVLAALRAARSGERSGKRSSAETRSAGDIVKAAKRAGRSKAATRRRAAFAAPGNAVPPTDHATASNPEIQADPTIPAVSLGRLRKTDYDRPRAPQPALHLTFDTQPVSGAVIRQLGLPPGWSSKHSPDEMLGPVVRATAEVARRIALMEAGAKAATSDRQASRKEST